MLRKRILSFFFTINLIFLNLKHVDAENIEKNEEHDDLSGMQNVTSVKMLENDIKKYSSVDDTFSLLQEGENYLHLEESKNVILVLGNTGSGKTTLTQFIAGDNSKLRAVEVETGTGEYIIVDDRDKIGYGIYSKTLVPERVFDSETKLVYYDCPGFSDTRNAAFDIASSYFLKKTVDHVKSVKIILTISYSSVRIGVDRVDFMKLVRHTNEFIKDIEKYKNSITLVVTKVDNEYIKKNGQFVIIPDEKVIKKIAKYIKQVRESLQDSINSENGSRRILLNKYISLIDIFLSKNENKYTNIALFRRPDTDGVLSNISLLQTGKKYVKNIIENDIVFVKKDENEFGFTISDSSKNSIYKLVDKINKQILSDVSHASNNIEKSFKSKTTNSDNLYAVKDDMHALYNKLFKCLEELEKCTTHREFILKFTNFINELDVKNSREIFLEILKKYKYMEFFEQISNENFAAKSVEWTQPLRSVEQYATVLKIWYSYLTDLYEKMSEYKVYTSVYEKIFKTNKRQKRNIVSLEAEKLLYKLNDNDLKYSSIIASNISIPKSNQQRDLNNVIHSIYDNNVTVSCSELDTLVVRGDFVKFSIIDSSNVCSKKVKTIKIFALNSVFVDTDLIRTGDKLNVIVIAPRWEVVGRRKIVLDGDSQQDTYFRPAPNGEDGSPGLPGGTAGNFIGIGSKIINPEQLTISARGGDGARGQDGGQGFPGRDGYAFLPSGSYEQGIEMMKRGRYTLNDIDTQNTAESFLEYIGYIIGIYHQLEVSCYRVYSDEGQNGGNGGMGGAGGKGGLQGEILLYGLDGKEHISILKHNGADGEPGDGGPGGNGGRGGQIYNACHVTKKSYWFGGEFKSTDRSWHQRKLSSSGHNAPPGITNAGVTRRNIRSPADTNPIIISYPINDYKLYLLDNINNNIKHQLLTRFYLELNNDTAIQSSYDSIGLFYELRNLENQYNNIHGSMDLRNFYKSLMTRIDKYSLTPKDYEKTLHHRKFLSFLRTATHSRMLSLKNQKSTDLVIDMNKYFSFVTSAIEKIKHDTKQAVINEAKNNYKRTIDNRIQEAEHFIENIIIPDIQHSETQIGYEFEYLIDEIIELRNKSETKKNELIKRQEVLEKNIKQNSILSVLKIFGTLTKFLGPVGESIGEVVDTTNSVADTLLLSSGVKIKTEFSLPKGVEDMFKKEFIILEYFVGKKMTALHHFLDVLFQETQNYPEELKNDFGKFISMLKSNLTRVDLNKTEASISSVSSIIDRITKFLTRKVSDINSNSTEVDNQESPDDTILKDVSNSLQLFLRIVKVIELFTDGYLDNKDDRRKIQEIANAIGDQDLNMNKLLKYQEEIYKSIFPLFKKVRANLLISRTNISSKSIAGLSVLQKEISASLQDMKMILRKITNGFKMQGSLERSVEKIDEALTLLVKIYDRLGNYNENKELADYIADIHSDRANKIETNNDTISNAITNLDVIVKSGIVVEQFQKAIAGFKQFIFPFSNYYLEEFNMFAQINPNASLESLVSRINRQINNLNSKLTDHQLSIKKHFDTYIRQEYFQSGEKFTGPFFVWDSDKYGNEISKLLSGEEIVLKADILTSVHEKNAIKFNKIEIRFNSADASTVQEIEEALSYFSVTMKHSGNSYYRCDNTFYLITGDSQTLFYSFDKDKHGKPVRTNNVYLKITDGDYMLSPYTTWTIQLKHVRKNNVTTLDSFKRKVDLELIGHGEYVTPKNGICGSGLKQYYETVNTLSVTDVLNKKV